MTLQVDFEYQRGGFDATLRPPANPRESQAFTEDKKYEDTSIQSMRSSVGRHSGQVEMISLQGEEGWDGTALRGPAVNDRRQRTWRGRQVYLNHAMLKQVIG